MKNYFYLTVLILLSCSNATVTDFVSKDRIFDYHVLCEKKIDCIKAQHFKCDGLIGSELHNGAHHEILSLGFYGEDGAYEANFSCGPPQ